MFPDYSRSRLQQWIRDGQVLLDGEIVKPRTRLAGDEVGHGRRWIVDMRQQHRHPGLAVEGALAGRHLVEHHAERVEVGARVELGRAGLLG